MRLITSSQLIELILLLSIVKFIRKVWRVVVVLIWHKQMVLHLILYMLDLLERLVDSTREPRCDVPFTLICLLTHRFKMMNVVLILSWVHLLSWISQLLYTYRIRWLIRDLMNTWLLLLSLSWLLLCRGLIPNRVIIVTIFIWSKTVLQFNCTGWVWKLLWLFHRIKPFMSIIIIVLPCIVVVSDALEDLLFICFMLIRYILFAFPYLMLFSSNIDFRIAKYLIRFTRSLLFEF